MLAMAVAQMPPQQQAVAPMQLQINRGTHGQQNFGGHVPVWQTGDDGCARLAAQPLHRGVQVEAFVLRIFLIFGELPQHNGLLLVKHACVQQLGQHAFDAVGVFGHIFQKQHALVDLRKVGGAQQAGEHA